MKTFTKEELVHVAGAGSQVSKTGECTLDEAIAKLTAMKNLSPLGGDTMVYWCGLGSETDDLPVCDIRLELYDDDGDAAMVYFYTNGPLPEL